MRSTSLVVALLFVVTTVFAGDPPATHTKKAWEWTTEERIASRTNAALAADRVRAMKGSSPASRIASNSASGARMTDGIDGNRNPELFLPHELFEILIRHGYVGETWRDYYAPDMLVASNLPADFWDRLEVAAPDYVAGVQRENELLLKMKGATPAERERLQREIASMIPTMCRARIAGLRNARKAFGASFDRFLYEHVAPGSSMATDDPLDGDRLRTAAEGCVK